MNNISGNKMLAHLDRVVGEHRPITADVFLTNYCNNNCRYCTYKRWNLRHGVKAMSFDEFVLYASRMLDLGVKGFILTGGGEPTICPDFMKITRWLEDRNIDYGINTNFNNLLYFSPNYLKVSLDGYDEDSYEASRGVRAYKKTVENIKAYSEWRRKNSQKTSLGVQWVATDAEGVKRFYEANKQLDVDYFAFRPIESTDGEFYNSTERLEKSKRIVNAVKEIMVHDPRVVLNFKWNLLGMRFEECHAQWSQLAINEYGEVMYCCHKPYEIVGHIMDDDILEKKKKATTNMSMCDVPCRLTAPNSFVLQATGRIKDPNFI